ncbi:replication initiation protein [Ralstonia phage Raharianne]|uniref:Uncharacterized protein n=2 Tax=Rahariannevirus raharianne TaxID=2846050 RepID=A0A7G5BBA2_9CAUD|nr:replication initiation protein [Ralstonia phage Raharianne]QMV32381.1 hypothetical protein U2_00006 [Ralstonia phage Albius]QMV33575.1 hypothetical protein Y2_00006 [Ralstonia phage Raharianne]
MAGEWIKMRADLHDDPAVFRLSTLLKIDKFSVIGRLHTFWSWVDRHSVDGRVDGAASTYVDEVVRQEGFADALAVVGWLVVDETGIAVPNFYRHNGDSAKSRAQKSDRQARWRKKKDVSVDIDVDGDASTQATTREEKRREEVNNPPNPPSPDGDEGAETEIEKTSKRERKPRTALKTFLAACRANGVKPVTTYAPLMEYVEGVGLPADFLELAWDVFCHEHLDGGTNAARLQANWQQHFANYVTKGYYRLWVCKPDGTFELTSAGQQARRFHKQEAA